MQSADGGQRYLALDSLRGVAACMVLLFHFYAPNGHLWRLPFVQGGWVFVDFFFVLSGFVIFASYGDRLRSGFSIGRYMVLRAGRIYPLHVTVLLAFVAWEALGAVLPLLERGPFTGPNQPAGLLYSLLLVQPLLTEGRVWNGPSWSIAAEFWTYLAAGLLFAFGGRLFWLAVGAVILGSGVILTQAHYLREVQEFAVFRSLFGFGFGMIAFAQFRQWRDRVRLPFGWATAIELALAAVGLAFVSITRTGGWPTMFAAPAFAVGVFVFAFQAGAVSRLLLTAPFRLLGLLSYSIYLTHLFMIERLHDAIEPGGSWSGFATIGVYPTGEKFIAASPLVSDILLAVLLAAVIAVSWLTFRYVEQPAREWSRRLVGRPATWRVEPVSVG